MYGPVNVLALVKGCERYIFLFDDTNRTETLRQIGRFAANPELSFTWYDAAVMSQKIRQEAKRNGEAHQQHGWPDNWFTPPDSDTLNQTG